MTIRRDACAPLPLHPADEEIPVRSLIRLRTGLDSSVPWAAPPLIVLSHLKESLIEPDEPLRNGYVPNVVYTCGALVHCGKLILPYRLSDTTITVATIDLTDLLAALVASRN